MSWFTAVGRAQARDAIRVLRSGLFDRKYYEQNNPDVPRGPLASLRHFLLHGGKEGRAPSPSFDSSFYLRRYPDVKEAGINPLLHYLRFGRAELRIPTRYSLASQGVSEPLRSQLKAFFQELQRANENKLDVPVDMELAALFGAQQPERREIRRIIADVFLAGNGIEVGALQDPLPVAGDVTIKYVDRFSKADLYKHYPELRGAPLVDVDIIDNGEQLFSVPAHSQDFIIANHFLEHTQDPIATLKNFCRVVKPGGFLYIAVPDQKSTFDCDRTPTTLRHLIEDYRDGASRSRHAHFREWVTLCEPHFGRTYSGEELTARIQELEDKDYSIHFHCWRPEDFLDFLVYCSHEERIGFSIKLFCRCPGEIVVVLKAVC